MSHDHLTRYVRLVADVFGLRDWNITVSENHCPEDTMADTETTYGQRHAVIRFNEKWAEWSVEELRSTVVHELLHVHTEPVGELITDILTQSLDEQASTVGSTAVSYLLERSVDQIAEAIAPYFPLPQDAS